MTVGPRPPAGVSSVTTVSTHVLDTGLGRPAAGVPVRLCAATAPGPATAGGAGGEAVEPSWTAHAAARTDADGRCAGLPPLPAGATHARLTFDVAPYQRAGAAAGGFFPEVTVAFAVTPGEHHHVPLLLSPYGYTVYRGS